MKLSFKNGKKISRKASIKDNWINGVFLYLIILAMYRDKMMLEREPFLKLTKQNELWLKHYGLAMYESDAR